MRCGRLCEAPGAAHFLQRKKREREGPGDPFDAAPGLPYPYLLLDEGDAKDVKARLVRERHALKGL